MGGTATATITDDGGGGGPVVERDGNTATAIRDLVIGGVTYDVEFTLQTAADLYGDPPTFDFDTFSESQDAASAVGAVLEAEGDILFVGDSAGNGVEIYYVPYSVVGGGAFRWVITSPTTGDAGFWTTSPTFLPWYFPAPATL